MTRRLSVLLVVGSLLTPLPGTASERSQVLSARGLVEFHAGQYSKALAFFDQALADDPTDISARYYRAAARAHLDDYPGAIVDLQAVLAAQPNFNQAALDLGVALIETKQYLEAVPWLEQAQHAPALEARASLFLGIAYLRCGQLENAQTNFERAAKDPEQELTARYYQGVTDYQTGNASRAAERFDYVVKTSPDTPMGREAAAFLVKLGRGQHRRYQLYAALGFLYDSNVILAPSSGAAAAEGVLNVSQQGDFLTTIAAGGTVVPWATDTAQLSVGYDFYQSLHKELHQFNLQDNGPNAQISAQVGRVGLALLGRYDYYLLESQSFLQEATALPWATVALGTLGRFELFFRMLRQDYKIQAYSVRNCFDYATGGRQFFYLGSPDRYLSIGYQYDQDVPVASDAEAESFGYTGNEVNAGAGWPLPLDSTVEAGYAYRYERFRAQSAEFNSGNRRHDDENLVVIAFRKQLQTHLAVTAGYLGDFNYSNDGEFKYDRSIVSLMLEGRF
ncbi:MAG TPA: tetratricopeptide repeat protein [Candidatus Margulisiibacteriota bacterium]|nr:tetratricopeptide repeat protein [Candidatus Margulisiibacteriota bacterium]